MQLKHTNGRFEALCGFDEKDIPKSAGFRWDNDEKVWYTGDVRTALTLKEYADSACLQRLAESAREVSEAFSASHATDADLIIPAPAGFEYLPFQKAGIAYALRRKATLIADEMGLGKTIQALGLINADPEIKKVLVIAPAGLRLNWQKEAGKWLINSLPVLRAAKTVPTFDAGVLVLGYEEATKFAPILDEMSWDLIVADEAHYLKNEKAKRTKAILALTATRWLLLTGTPILNRPKELFPLLQKVDPRGLGVSFFSYANRYCAAKRDSWGYWDYSGASNLEELNFKLRSGGMIRRLKADVLTSLPPKRHALIPLEPSAAAKKLIAEEKKKALEALKAARRAKQLQGKDPIAFAEDIKKLRDEAHAIEFCEIARIRHELARLKVEQVVNHVSNALASEPIIVFAHHQDVAKAIADGLSPHRVALITGAQAKEDQHAAVEAFQAGKLDCVVCSLKAAGVGITLTKSSHVVIAELDWTPGGMDQAEDRAHRIGQTESVLIEWLVLDGSLEVKMAKTLSHKKNIANTALGDTNGQAQIGQAEFSEITAEDLARAKENEEKELEKSKSKLAALAALAEVKAGRYAVILGGEAKAVNLKLSGKGNFYTKRGDGDISFSEGEAVAKILAALTKDQRTAAQREYGKLTGNCCQCGRALTDPLSAKLGIGPDCGAGEHAAAAAEGEAL